MHFILIKKNFFSATAKIIYMVVVTFFLLDFIFSNTIIKEMINKDCFKYTRYSLNEKNFYSYDLKENCRAYETKKTIKTYNVFTDQNGHRIASRNTKKIYKEKSAVFLGDSFTYGFGLNYEESIVGLLETKVTNYNFFNLAVPGYSPLILKYKLENFLKSNSRINKIFYLMDLTDVHDESNRWIKIQEFDHPVILDKTTHNLIEKDFNLKANFKMTKLLAYSVNKLLRDLRKTINRKEFEKRDKIIGFTKLGSFTHIPYEDLDKNTWSENDFKVGIENINKHVKLISNIAREINSDFYIVIFPWPETLHYGEKHFNWQDYGSNLCKFVKCTRLINTFPEYHKKKEQLNYWKKELYHLEDIHFNAKGSSLLSDIIYNEAFKN